MEFEIGRRGKGRGRRGGGDGLFESRREAMDDDVDALLFWSPLLEIGAVAEPVGRVSNEDSRAPTHASRRRVYVAKPSFHEISFQSCRCRLRFRCKIGCRRESGLSYL